MAYSIDEAIAHIRRLDRLEHLKEEDFCQEGGLADGPMADFIDRREPLKPTQLRKIFNELIAYERRFKPGGTGDFSKAELIRVLPKLAYATGRDLIPKDFYDLMTECIKKVNSGADFLQFMAYVRALMAYHKYETKYQKRLDDKHRNRRGGRA